MGGLSALLLILVGLVSGFVMSLIGASAVMIVVPSLNLLFSYGIHAAIGVSLMVDFIASIAVGYAYWRNGNVQIRQAAWVALGTILGAQTGAICSVGVPEVLMGFLYGVSMISSGYFIWKKGLERHSVSERLGGYLKVDSDIKRIAVSLALGIVIGINCGIFGAGGGVLIMLVLIFVMDYPIHSAVGTSTVIMSVTAASAIAGYWRLGNIDTLTSLTVSLGTVVGGFAGARFANSSSEEDLIKVVGGVFIVIGVIMTLLRLL